MSQHVSKQTVFVVMTEQTNTLYTVWLCWYVADPATPPAQACDLGPCVPLRAAGSSVKGKMNVWVSTELNLKHSAVESVEWVEWV